MSIVLEQQISQQGLPVANAYVIKQLVGVRVIEAAQSERLSATLGDVLTGEEVDKLIEYGHNITLTLEKMHHA